MESPISSRSSSRIEGSLSEFLKIFNSISSMSVEKLLTILEIDYYNQNPNY